MLEGCSEHLMSLRIRDVNDKVKPGRSQCGERGVVVWYLHPNVVIQRPDAAE